MTSLRTVLYDPKLDHSYVLCDCGAKALLSGTYEYDFYFLCKECDTCYENSYSTKKEES